MKEVFGKNTVTSREFPVILFDAGGTILHSNPTYEKIYETILQERRSPLSMEEIEKIFVSVVREFNAESENNANFELKPSLWADAFVHHWKGAPDKELASALSTGIVLKSKMVIAQTTVDLLTILRERGYRLGLVSNWNGLLADVLRGEDILDLFDSIVTSVEVGFWKPHSKIFEAALEDLDVSASQVIVVGESYAADMVGARRLQMKKILYDPRFRELRALLPEDTSGKVVSIDALKHNRRCDDIRPITRFEELLDILL